MTCASDRCARRAPQGLRACWAAILARAGQSTRIKLLSRTRSFDTAIAYDVGPSWLGTLHPRILIAADSSAQAYPTKPVRMVVPLVPGGSVDNLARALAQKMSESMGQQVFVDNRGGASGNIGTELVVRAPADGYTIMTVSMTLVVNPFLFPEAAVRRRTRSRADLAGRCRSAGAGRAPVGARKNGGRAPGVGESAPG